MGGNEKRFVSEVQRHSEVPCSSPADPIDPARGPDRGWRSDPLLRVVASAEERSPIWRSEPAPQEWDGLVDLVHGTARRLRRVEAGARDQERSGEDALRRARDGIVAAERHAQQAEAQADAVRQRADARIAAAEARARAAEAQAREVEDRARHAEAWLVRVQATILSAFPEPSAQATA